MPIDLRLPAPVVARALIGATLLFEDERGVRGGMIIETEAYTADDPASHSFAGPTSRNQAMFMEAGTMYVYRIYGMHFCMNIVCGAGDGQAVLIRALRPTRGIELLRANRPGVSDAHLCDGPAKLVQALGITQDLDRKHITFANITLIPSNKSVPVQTTPRIGISKAIDKPWRFVYAGV